MALPAELKSEIQTAYSSWLKNNNFKPRTGQRQMIAAIANALHDVAIDDDGHRCAQYDRHVMLLEAGTGTGKTIAYAIAGIALARHLDKQLVISTATITLQEQLVLRDLPNLAQTGDIDFSFAIAKGRRRYLCRSKLANHLSHADSSASAQPLFPDEEPVISDESWQQLRELDDGYRHQGWDGDFDRWPSVLTPEQIELVAADRASCSGRKCPWFSDCALFNSRDALREAQVIVVNHDLLLADLANPGSSVLPAAEDCIFVIDEAHHLPEKAQSRARMRLRMSTESNRSAHSSKLLEKISQLAGDNDAVFPALEAFAVAEQASSAALLELDGLLQRLVATKPGQPGSDDRNLRFSHGEVPQSLGEAFAEYGKCVASKLDNLQRLSQIILDQFVADASPEQSARESLHTQLASLAEQLEMVWGVCESYAHSAKDSVDSPCARWLQVDDEGGGGLSAHTTPLATGAILDRILWRSCYAAVLTSATLAPTGSFEPLIGRLGAGSEDNAQKILGALNFPAAIFHVPAMQSNPADPLRHTEEVTQMLPELLADVCGALVLFASRRQMQDVYAALDDTLRQQVLVQGDRAKHVLLEAHRERVDAGARSILFGLTSFAEGLDLPGVYCEQVVIAKLAFAVPDDPVELAMGEWCESRGGNAFRDIALPAAALRLQQSAGRLLRSEQDTGRVSLLDTRIVSKSYGKALLSALPPFTMDIG